MQVVTVRLDRLFDIRRNGDLDNQVHVMFSCVADGTPHYAVRLPGNPRLEVGDRVTVVLRETGNWQSLAGWKNHSDGEVLVPGRGKHAGLPLLAATMAMAISGYTRATENRWVWVVATLALGGLFLAMASGALEARRAARLLAQT